MQICRMDYRNLYDNGAKALLHCYGVGSFAVFSGKKPFVNASECSDIPLAALPPGQYWIVDRPTGSLGNKIRQKGLDLWWGTDHDSWFGLFSFQTMTDSLYVNGIQRGQFRLHPLRPDGSGESWGCITFFKGSDFEIVSKAIRRQKKFRVPGHHELMAYGRVDVTGSTNFDFCKLR